MKRRTLTFGIAAQSDSNVSLADFSDPISISDFDAFIFDPAAFVGLNFATGFLSRRQAEIRELIELKGGIVVCVLRPSRPVEFRTGSAATAYSLLDGVSCKAHPWI